MSCAMPSSTPTRPSQAGSDCVRLYPTPILGIRTQVGSRTSGAVEMQPRRISQPADHLADHRGRLRTVLIVTLTVLIAEVIGAAVSGSLALLADAGHMLSDVAGLTLAWVA